MYNKNTHQRWRTTIEINDNAQKLAEFYQTQIPIHIDADFEYADLM